MNDLRAAIEGALSDVLSDDSRELEAELGRLRHGQHLCLLYESPAALRATLVPYFRDGLAKNERCLYIADADSADAAARTLADAGLDVGGAMARGQLQVLTTREAYHPHGRFEPEAMLELMDHSADEAIADGFTGLRGSGEMAWALGPEPGNERLMEYEALLNDVIERHRFVGICRYNMRRFPPSMIRDVLRVHPFVVLGSLVCPSAYYEPPDMFLGRTSETDRLGWSIAQLYRTRAAKRELEHAVHARDEFLSIASHELRTPLTSLSLQLQSLEREIDRRGIDGALDKKTKTARKSADRLTALVEQMLDVSRIATGRMEIDIHCDVIDLAELVNEIVDRFREANMTGGCQVTVDASGPVIGSWDPVRLDQVLTNLLANACRYGLSRPIAISVHEGGEQAIVTVRDQGIGIAPKDQPRIFEPFERAVSRDNYGGLGLGLFIARRIVEAHGGTITVESQPGRGAAFTITLQRSAHVTRLR